MSTFHNEPAEEIPPASAGNNPSPVKVPGSPLAIAEVLLWLDTLRQKLLEGASLPPETASGVRKEGSPTTSGAEPDIDIYENEREFLIHIALPGVEPEAIHLEATGNTLLMVVEEKAIQAHASQKPQEKYPTQHRRSRLAHANRFRFAYRFTSDILPSSACAEFRHGLLEIKLPKKEKEHSLPVVIPVQQHREKPAQESESRPPSAPPKMRVPEARQNSASAPIRKMGQTYTPNSAEDHAAQTQAIGARTESADSQITALIPPQPERPVVAPPDSIASPEIHEKS